ncbi:hypothetical protein GCM10020220_068460 [Nonomuraea rubra]
MPRDRASPPSAAPVASPPFRVAWSAARTRVRSAGGIRAASRAWRAADRPVCAVPYRQATRANAANERASRKPATATAVAIASSTATPRGPRRSARWPSGTPATEPTPQPSVRPSPISAAERPTMPEK